MFLFRRFPKTLAAAGLVFCFTGCSGSSDSQTPADTSTGDPNVLVGTFAVTLVAPDASTSTDGYTSVVGRVSDGPTPSQVQYTESATVGACKLLLPSVPFCNQACTGGAVCVAADTCQSYPSGKSVGTVHVSGLRTNAGATEFSMEAVSNNYQPSVSCPYPAFAEGDAVTLTSSGGAYAPFTLNSQGISPLNLLSTNISLQSGQALSLSWTAPAASSGSKIDVKLDISHHGGTKGMITCTTDDTGSLSIDASLITQLLNLGTAGYPTIIVTRTAPVGSAVIAPGRVDLTISSGIEQAVTVPGVTSCKDTTDCPAGKTCQSDLTCK